MVARLSANDHKKLLEEALVGNITFKSLSGTMPCKIMVDDFCFNVYVNYRAHILKEAKMCGERNYHSTRILRR